MIQETTTDEAWCLLIDCPLRIHGSPELVSVQSTGRTEVRAETVWELALAVWQGGAAGGDECKFRFGSPEAFQGRSLYLRQDINRLVREHRDGTRDCVDLMLPVQARAKRAPRHGATPGWRVPCRWGAVRGRTVNLTGSQAQGSEVRCQPGGGMTF